MKKRPASGSLIFIDTNKFLDYYRISRAEIISRFLELIVQNRQNIITTYLIEMEFKKNRQRVVIDKLVKFERNYVDDLRFPSIVAESQPALNIQNLQLQIEEQINKIKTIYKNLLVNPCRHDRIYHALEKLFTYRSNIILNNNHEKKKEIMEMASARFYLGYPPRKSSDNAFGDAINWEWIIHCANLTGKDIIIVTRDKDFGTIYDNRSYLNDWLLEEFDNRKNNKQKLLLTNQLTHALKINKVAVSKELINEEQRLLN